MYSKNYIITITSLGLIFINSTSHLIVEVGVLYGNFQILTYIITKKNFY